MAKGVELAARARLDRDPGTIEHAGGIDPLERRDHPLGAVRELLAADPEGDRDGRRAGQADVEVRLMDVEPVGEDVRRAGVADRLLAQHAGVLQLDEPGHPLARLPRQADPEAGEKVVLVVARARAVEPGVAAALAA